MVPSYKEVEKIRLQAENVSTDHWLHHDFLTWKWWILVVLAILPWIIWYLIADKKRLNELLTFGFFIALVTGFLDDFGTPRIWWGYPDKLIPAVPPLFPIDFTLVPVFLMIMYQVSSKTWRSFFIGTVTLGLFMAFVCEPLFVWMGYYVLHTWKYIYSFCFYLAVSFLGRLITSRTTVKQ